MKAIFVVLAFTAAALASCPNSCSGHGRCNAFDRCECYRQEGTTWARRVMYTGADCSERTCPLGSAFGAISSLDYSVSTGAIALDPQRQFSGAAHSSTTHSAVLSVDSSDYKLAESQTFNVRVLSESGGTILAQWKLAGQATYSRVFTMPMSADAAIELGGSGSGTVLANEGTANTGVRVYATGSTNVYENHLYTFTVNYREGRPYSTAVANSAHQESECSGRGLCDRGTGRCRCFGGYQGEACQRTSCPNDCNGHGICQSLARFVADTSSVTYKAIASGGAFDATKEFGCLCDVGYRGADCALVECPSGGDPLGGAGGNGLDGDVLMTHASDCSGRGVCDYSSGTCSCFKGYTGTRCENSNLFMS